MPLIEISLDDYAAIFPTGHSVYDSPAFIALNSHKVSEVKIMALVDHDGRPLVAQTFGLKADGWHAPFSAPFSAPVITLNGSEADVKAFYESVREALPEGVALTFPPECYGAVHIPEGRTVHDYNYHYPLARLADYESHLSRSGRYSHRRALRYPFEFTHTEDIPRAYEIIRLNRAAMGYPLAMSLAQVPETAPVTRA
ncbi:MAG: hypothetical protein K2M19_00055, partial [Muribaculaceae bacterium]|nr:hypothetical protein [Muribaculaceae bacterium]